MWKVRKLNIHTTCTLNFLICVFHLGSYIMASWSHARLDLSTGVYTVQQPSNCNLLPRASLLIKLMHCHCCRLCDATHRDHNKRNRFQYFAISRFYYWYIWINHTKFIWTNSLRSEPFRACVINDKFYHIDINHIYILYYMKNFVF
jgi:hypothetical protein